MVVPLGHRAYTVRVTRAGAGGFAPFARGALDATWAGRATRKALIVTDRNVGPMVGPYRDGLASIGIGAEVAAVEPGEPSKSIATAATLYDRLIALRADRHTAVVAIGGGVVGDLAGFVAATYARGLPLLMVPTTLLAQVDSSVGGKVGVNLPGAKNIVGAFHQPVGVWIDAATIPSLPTRERVAGLAEVIKYGVILDADFLDEIEATAEALVAGDPEATRRAVARSCRLKASVVAEDEREETGLRAVLNFGHTIGHAIEAVAGYDGPFRHGEAVAVGMVAEARIAERIGWVGPDLADRLVALLRRVGLPTAAPGLDPAALVDAIGLDKKNRGGRARLVLPRRVGRVELTDAPTEADLRHGLASILDA